MNIGKLGALWALMTGGWAGLAEYVLVAVNEWLATLDQSKFAEAAKIIRAIAQVIRILLDTFLPDRYKAAAMQTLLAFETLANAMEDGNITPEELSANIDAIKAAIEAWKKPKMMTRLVVLAALLAALAGCRDSGVYAVVGDLNAPVDISDASDTLTARVLFSMSGAKVWSRKNSVVKMKYTNVYTNDYIGCITKRGVQDFDVSVEPCEDAPVVPVAEDAAK